MVRRPTQDIPSTTTGDPETCATRVKGPVERKSGVVSVRERILGRTSGQESTKRPPVSRDGSEVEERGGRRVLPFLVWTGP